MRYTRLAAARGDNLHSVSARCRRAASAAAARAAAPDAAHVHADAPGIAWFNGDVDAAFKAAQGV